MQSKSGNIYTSKELAKAEVYAETVINNKYMHWTPTPAQANLLLCDETEVLWGGSAGPGKSVGLLFAATQHVEISSYSALLLRKTFKQLTEAKALIDLSKIWFAKHRDSGGAHWNEKDKLWTFPSGAKIKFGYLDSVNDKYNFQGAEYQFIGFDELTQFDQDGYQYLYSRLRKTKDNPVPLRMWSTSNPGGYGHEWVKDRFVPDDYRPEDRKQYYYKEHEMYDGSFSKTVFIPAFIDDNPHLDKKEYMKSLAHLDTVTRHQLMNGDWTARHEGMMFRREWILGTAGERLVDAMPYDASLVRYWDCAATEKKFGDGKDPDYTASMLLGELDGEYFIGDVTRMRGTPKQVEDHIRKTALKDKMKYRGRLVRNWMEEERGQSGKAQISHYQRNVLNGYWFKGDRATGDKKERAATPSVACEAGVVYAVKDCENLGAFLNEAEIFPHGKHDDMVDGFSGAFNKVRKKEAFLI